MLIMIIINNVYYNIIIQLKLQYAYLVSTPLCTKVGGLILLLAVVSR